MYGVCMLHVSKLLKTPAADHRRPPFHPHPPTTWMQAGRRKKVSALPNAWSKDVGWSSRRKSLQAGSDFRRELHLARASQEVKKMSKVVWIWSGFERFLGSFWDLLGSFWDLEALFSEKGKKVQKVVRIWPGFETFLAPF